VCASQQRSDAKHSGGGSTGAHRATSRSKVNEPLHKQLMSLSCPPQRQVGIVGDRHDSKGAAQKHSILATTSSDAEWWRGDLPCHGSMDQQRQERGEGKWATEHTAGGRTFYRNTQTGHTVFHIPGTAPSYRWGQWGQWGTAHASSVPAEAPKPEENRNGHERAAEDAALFAVMESCFSDTAAHVVRDEEASTLTLVRRKTHEMQADASAPPASDWGRLFPEHEPLQCSSGGVRSVLSPEHELPAPAISREPSPAGHAAVRRLSTPGLISSLHRDWDEPATPGGSGRAPAGQDVLKHPGSAQVTRRQAGERARAEAAHRRQIADEMSNGADEMRASHEMDTRMPPLPPLVLPTAIQPPEPEHPIQKISALAAEEFFRSENSPWAQPFFDPQLPAPLAPPDGGEVRGSGPADQGGAEGVAPPGGREARQGLTSAADIAGQVGC